MTTKISLIIPLYNAEKYLEACLDSVAEQTFKDFECLCINDGSKDNTIDIVKKFVAKDSRFRLIEQKNQGCSMARNKGMSEAKSEYVAFLDQDDLLHPQAFEMLLYLIEKENADMSAFKFYTVPTDFVLDTPKLYDLSKVKYKYLNNPFKDFFKRKKGSAPVIWNRLYRRDMVKDLTFPQDVQPAEDTVFLLKVLAKAKSAVVTKEIGLFYRDSDTSVYNQGKTENYLLSHLRAGQVLYDYFSGSVLNEKDRATVMYFITRMLYKCCVSQYLRAIKYGSQDKLIEVSQKSLIEMKKSGVYNPCLLDMRKRLVSHLFLNNYVNLAKLIV